MIPRWGISKVNSKIVTFGKMYRKANQAWRTQSAWKPDAILKKIIILALNILVLDYNSKQYWKNKTNQSGWRYNTQNKHRKRFWVSYWELKPLTYFRLPSLVVLGSWRIPSSSTRSHDSENNVKNTKHCKLLKKIKVQNIEIQFRNVWQ